MKIPSITLGKDSRKGFHPKRHDVNTTADFGFVQPTLCEYLPADSSVTLQSGTFVRLAPMPCPSFARVKVNQVTRFVDIHDIFEGYDYLQSHQPVNLLHHSYIPLKADSIKARRILGHMINMSLYASRFSDFEHLSKLMFRCSVWSNSKLYQGEEKLTDFDSDSVPRTGDLHFKTTGYRWKDVMNDSSLLDNRWRQYNGYRIIDALMRDSDHTTGEYTFGTSPFWTTIKSYTGMENLIYPQNGNVGGIDFTPDIKFFMTEQPRSCKPLPTSSSGLATDGRWPTSNESLGYLWRYYYGTVGSSFTLDGADDTFEALRSSNNLGEFTEGMSIENADFVMKCRLFTGSRPGRVIPLVNDNGESTEGTRVTDVALCFHLTSFGRRLMKVLTGTGYQFKYDTEKSLLPLLGYYKVWFDTFNPGRDRQWKDTPAYYLIHSYYDTGTDLDTVLRDGYSSTELSSIQRYRTVKAWFDFLGDLSQCCYSQPIDNVTVATQEIYNDSVESSAEGVATPYLSNTSTQVLESNYYSGDAHTVPQKDEMNELNSLNIKALQRLYTLFNKNSVIGARVDKYLRAHFGYGLPESNVLGRSDILCNIDDTFSTTQNSEIFLGEFAGKGIGGEKIDNAQRMRFETAKPGYLYNLLCVVPDGGYVQGAKCEPLTRYDFFDSFYDCLGKETLNYSNVEGRTSVFINNIASEASDKIFGFVPRYFGLKIKNSLANGGFAFRSQRAQFLPYSLDRLFDEDEIEMSSDGVTLQFVPGVSLVANEALRYIGMNERYGNYNRLFYDASGRTDNFIIDIVHDFKHWFPGKSLSDSFETFDKDTDNATVEIDHA